MATRYYVSKDARGYGANRAVRDVQHVGGGITFKCTANQTGSYYAADGQWSHDAEEVA